MLALLAGALPGRGASTPAALTGVVRDARGVPQMGALIELLSSDASPIAEAYTNQRGVYRIDGVFPGTYELKATGAFFLPTLRENLRIHGSGRNVVNIVLNTLDEAIQWLPAKPRSPDEPDDDWKWTLRSSSNRPLLRFLEDGPLVVVAGENSQSAPELEARVALAGASRVFGQSGPRDAFELERSDVTGGRLVLRADVNPEPDGGSALMAGFEQQMGPQRSVRTVAALERSNTIEGAGVPQQLNELVVRSAETMGFGANLSAEFGGQIESIPGASRAVENSPFAGLTWSAGGATVSYRASTVPGMQSAETVADAETFTPLISESQGTLRFEHGLHQELSVEEQGASFHALFAVYSDQIEDPMVEGGGMPLAGDVGSGALLFDPVADLIRVTGPNYGSAGLRAEISERLGAQTWATFSYASGSALAADGSDAPVTLDQALQSMRASAARAVGGAISGQVVRSGTRWQASYRWQPLNTVTPVDLFDDAEQSSFLGMLVRQPVRCGRLLPNGTEALVEVRNLLAQGYRPFLTSDGSTLYFAQEARTIEGGLSFSF